MKEIDFAAFEEAFKLNPVPTNRARDSIDNAVKTPTVKVRVWRSQLKIYHFDFRDPSCIDALKG